MVNELIKIFEKSNKSFIAKDIDLFKTKVSERTLCGALMIHMHEVIKETKYKDYYIDIEYNRNKGSKLKSIVKTIYGLDEKIIPITCDLIVHSRGNNVSQDNLIAIEMKKSNRPKDEKESDKERLLALTKDSFDDIWAFDGKSFPEHVCRYVLGVYYEVNYYLKQIDIEYYVKGDFYRKEQVKLAKFFSSKKCVEF